MVSTRRTSARPSPRRTRGESGAVTVSPQARTRCGDVLAVGGEHLVGIAAAGQPAVVAATRSRRPGGAAGPLRARPAATVVPARRSRSSATAARSRTSRSCRAKVWSMQQHRRGAKFSASSGTEQARRSGRLHRARTRLLQPGGQPQQAGLCRSRPRRRCRSPRHPARRLRNRAGARCVTRRNAIAINVRITTARWTIPKCWSACAPTGTSAPAKTPITTSLSAAATRTKRSSSPPPPTWCASWSAN